MPVIDNEAKMSKAAAIMGRKGGSVTGDSKARTREQAIRAARSGWTGEVGKARRAAIAQRKRAPKDSAK